MAATHGRHWTPLGVAGAAVSNRSSLDAVLLGCEQESNKVGLSKHGVVSHHGVVGLLSNEELGILDPEGVLGGVGTALAVFACLEEEEEGDPDEIADGNVSCCGYLVGGVQGLNNADREGPHSCWRIILLLIGREMASQTKVELPHAVVSGIFAPNGCEGLTDRAEVLLDRLLLDMLPLRRYKAGLDAIDENLEEGNGVLNVFEVGGDVHPAVEAPPSMPGGGVFIEDGCR